MHALASSKPFHSYSKGIVQLLQYVLISNEIIIMHIDGV